MSGEQPPPPLSAVSPQAQAQPSYLDDNGFENPSGVDDQDGWARAVGKKRKIPIPTSITASDPTLGPSTNGELPITHSNGNGNGNGNVNMKRPATPDDLHAVEINHHHDSTSNQHIATAESHTNGNGNSTGSLVRKKLRSSPARRLIEWKKELFVKRKANFISLYLDAQTALSATGITNQPPSQTPSTTNGPDAKNSYKNAGTAATATANAGKNNAVNGKTTNSGSNSTSASRRTNFPDVSEFEKLLPALEDINITSWTPDRQGWKSNQPSEPVKYRIPIYKRALERKKKVERKGWFPEGSFEFELECKASTSLRAKAKEQSALLKLANELRSLIITANKTSPVSSAGTVDDGDKSPSKTRRKLANRDTNVPAATPSTNAKEESQPMSQSQSKDSNETKTTANGGGGTKKKPKKKKRSVLANQSNPHHVDNYRPSRTVSPHGDPYEPYSSHLSLFNPPSMMFLATRPKRRVTNSNGEEVFMNMDIRPNEDDFICCFCEYDLYYSTEASRRKAIRRRRKEIKRKELIKSKAKNVAEGKKGSLRHDSESEYDSQGDEYEDDEDDDAFAGDDGDCHGDDGHGRCTCGRRVKKPKPDKDRDRDRDKDKDKEDG
uniref:Uncharacterized protein n=1 Tax=Kwoniella dejecticola CBS 10117 TaxID=1296121 RepID=A0A1A6A0Y5_9TREE|nr:uncharacterized protein I303_06000 [Kwoniella dejecticola CBS 10117]OBR83720.1 hypothetical protein I303_06000 [Kwoniella dejecticola CBS 10117]